MNNASMNIVCKFLCGLVFSVSFAMYLGGKLLGHKTVFNLLRNAGLFSKATVLFYIPTSDFLVVPIFLRPCPLSFFFFLNYNIPSGCEAVSHCGFDLHFPYE